MKCHPRWAVLLFALAVALPAQAETYRMDVIIYLDQSGARGELGKHPRSTLSDTAIDTSNVAALRAAGIEILPESQFGLNEQWQRLRNARGFQPLIKLAWTQKDPPGERGPALRIRFGQSLPVADPEGFGEFGVAPIEGSVALLLGRYLHLDADLQYTQPTSSGGYVSYKLNERRRMRRNELHHLDSPKLGILAMASKAS